MSYKASFLTSTYEADFRNRLRLTSVLNYMQEVAARNADQLGFGYHDFSGKGLYWVLSRTRILIDHYPEIGEEFVIETWPKGMHSIFANRDFRFYDQQGNITGRATTAWIIMNKNNHRPVRPESVMGNPSWVEAEQAVEEFPGRLEPMEVLHPAGGITAAYSDVDVNQHVNNVKYLEYILDSFRQEDFLSGDIIDFQINFLQELRYGESIHLKKGNQGHEHYVEGLSAAGEIVFQSRLVFCR